ncbi:hypothetical protein G3561_31370, partial [Micromonospora terminaliae]|nr:hypothetical protein [Micromonospora terminaliae]
MNTMLRKSVLGIAGLAVAGGLAAGPLNHHEVGPSGLSEAAVVQADKPDAGKLIPHGVQGAQSRIDLSDEQVGNAKAIIAATKKAGLPERAAVISIATSLQESKLENLG